MVVVALGRCSCVIMASLAACMQHIAEQCSLPEAMSREPTHCRIAIFFGSFLSDGRTTCPPVGPDAERSLSYSMLVTTFGKTPYPYSALSFASNSFVPLARITDPTLMTTVSSFCAKLIAPVPHDFSHSLHVPFRRYRHFDASITATAGTACGNGMRMALVCDSPLL